MSDLAASMAPPAEGSTIPVEGVVRQPAKPQTPTRLAVANIATTERTAGMMILIALGLLYLLRRAFRGALGD